MRPEKEEIKFYENWSRMQALKLWNQLHPKNKASEEDFFVGIDLNQLKHDDVAPQWRETFSRKTIRKIKESGK